MFRGLEGRAVRLCFSAGFPGLLDPAHAPTRSAHRFGRCRRHDAAQAATSECLLEQPLASVVGEGVGAASVDAHHRDAGVAAVVRLRDERGSAVPVTARKNKAPSNVR